MWVGGTVFLPPTCVCGVTLGVRVRMRIGAGRSLGRRLTRREGVSESPAHGGIGTTGCCTRPRSRGEHRARGKQRQKTLRAQGSELACCACSRAERPERDLACGQARGSPSVRPGRRALPTASLTRPGRDRAHRPRCWRTRCSGTGSSARGSRPRRGVRSRDESRARIG